MYWRRQGDALIIKLKKHVKLDSERRSPMKIPTTPTARKHQDIIEAVEEYTNNELAKIARHYDETEVFPTEPLQFFFNKRIFDLITSTSNDDLAVFLECIRIVSTKFASLASILLTQAFYAIAPIYHWGTDKQKETYLKDMLEGQTYGGLGLSENNGGGNTSYIQTTACETEAGWIINGSKQYVSNGTVADLFLIVAKTHKSNGAEGLGIFIVDRSIEGLSISEPLNKMGIKALPVTSVSLNQVNVKKHQLLGEEISGTIQTEQIMSLIKLAIAMQAIGIAQGSFTKGLDYMSIVRKFGNRLIDNEATQQKMANIKTSIHSSQAFVRQIITNEPKNKIEVAMAKLLTADVAVETTETIIQLTGGYGYMKDSEIERYIRDAKVTSIYGGSSDSQRKFIAQPWIDQD